MRFVTLFLKTENVHLLKDVGMIPYYLCKEHEVESSIVTYKNSEEYSYLDNEVKGLKIDFVKKTKFGKIIDGMWYLKKNAKNIDILNIYHLNLSSYFYEIAYKHYNPKGKIYLKLDMNPVGLINLFKKDLRGIIKRKTVNRADIASVETTKMEKRIRKFYGDKIIYVPNGCYKEDEADDSLGKCSKENVILTVGNLGTYEKATNVLLEGYAYYTAKNPDKAWKLRLVGSIDEKFGSYLEEFNAKHPELKDKITFTGPITDKQVLNEEYQKAKVFVLPSLSESFGIVLVEAAMKGCYLITSDMVPAGYDISDKYKFGQAVKAGDSFELGRVFLTVCNDNHDWDDMAIKTAAYVKTAFDWSSIINRLYRVLNRL